MKQKLLYLLGLIYGPLGLSTMGVGATITGIDATTKARIQAQTGSYTVDGDEILTVHKIIAMAAQESPFADNMVGRIGSGKPICINDEAKRVIGTTIIIPTRERLGAPVVQGNGVRNGLEEQGRTGDFALQVDLGWFGVGIDNTGKAQTIYGANWDDITTEDLALRLAKQQSDDTLICLKHSATPDNVILPNGKTIDTLGTGDTYSYSMGVKSGGRLRDLGARPVDARPIGKPPFDKSSKIARHIQFGTDTNSRPIKTDSAYLQALQFAQSRGEQNNLFTGEYQDVDNQIFYMMQCIQHGGYGSIGCPLQPEAVVGVAFGATDELTAVTIEGGGTADAAASTPYVNYFENFSRFPWMPINGVQIDGRPEANATAVTGAFTPRDTYGYLAIVHASGASVGKISLFRYTTNTRAAGVTTKNTISGLTRLGPGGNEETATLVSGSIAYGTAPWTTTPDGLGYLGLATGVIPVGSKIYEVNSKGVPLGYGLGLGEMAAVCGYGRVPIPPEKGGGFATMARKTMWTEPHDRGFSEGLQVSWGVAAFKRPNGKLPNYTLNIFARKVDGFPIIS